MKLFKLIKCGGDLDYILARNISINGKTGIIDLYDTNHPNKINSPMNLYVVLNDYSYEDKYDWELPIYNAGIVEL